MPQVMTTSKQLTLDLGEEKSMSSPVDFHANRSVPQEKGWEKKMNAIFGPKCSEQSEKSDQPTSWGSPFHLSRRPRTTVPKERLLGLRNEQRQARQSGYPVAALVYRTAPLPSPTCTTPGSQRTPRTLNQQLTPFTPFPAFCSRSSGCLCWLVSV